jgi:hypothetical protein
MNFNYDNMTWSMLGDDTLAKALLDLLLRRLQLGGISINWQKNYSGGCDGSFVLNGVRVRLETKVSRVGAQLTRGFVYPMFRYHGLSLNDFDICFMLGIRWVTSGGLSSEQLWQRIFAETVMGDDDFVNIWDSLHDAFPTFEVFVISSRHYSWAWRQPSSDQGFNLGMTVYPQKANSFEELRAPLYDIDRVEQVVEQALNDFGLSLYVNDE